MVVKWSWVVISYLQTGSSSEVLSRDYDHGDTDRTEVNSTVHPRDDMSNELENL